MFSFIVPKHQNIIHEAENAVESRQNFAHSLLKMFRSTGNAKGHLGEMVTAIGCDECC